MSDSDIMEERGKGTLAVFDCDINHSPKIAQFILEPLKTPLPPPFLKLKKNKVSSLSVSPFKMSFKVHRRRSLSSSFCQLEKILKDCQYCAVAVNNTAHSQLRLSSSSSPASTTKSASSSTIYRKSALFIMHLQLVHLHQSTVCQEHWLLTSLLRKQKSAPTLSSQTLPVQHYVFGYGSLINPISRQRTLSSPSSPSSSSSCSDLPVFVKGLVRSWNYNCRNEYTAVGVQRLPTGSDSLQGLSGCNGILTRLCNPSKQLAELDRREACYVRKLIQLSDIELLFSVHDDENVNNTDFVDVIRAIKSSSSPSSSSSNILVWVYEVPQKSSNEILQNRNHHHQANPNIPIPQTYLDCILTGCMQYGLDFASQFVRGTLGWPCLSSGHPQGTWLNDRNMHVSARKYVVKEDIGEREPSASQVEMIESLLASSLPHDVISVRV